jgi:hypothetical protein
MPSNTRTASRCDKKHHDDVVDSCLEVLQKGKSKDLFDFLPKISVLRDPCFIEPLLEMLHGKQLRKREFAALGLAELITPKTTAELCRCLQEKVEKVTPSYQRFQFAILQSIGRIGSDQAVETLAELVRSRKEPWVNPKWKEKIIDALGQIAQQGGKRALQALVDIVQGKDAALAVDALQEMSVAFWPCPNALPKKIFDLIAERLSAKNEILKDAAWEAMEDLARLGCRRAEKFLSSSLP